jgi:hypothetical protein
VHADHQQNFRLLRWHKGGHETITGSTRVVIARGGAGFDQGVCIFQCAANCRSRAALGGLQHPGHEFANARLLTPPNQLQIRVRHKSRGDPPLFAQANQTSRRDILVRRFETEVFSLSQRLISTTRNAHRREVADHVTDVVPYREGLAIATPAGLTLLGEPSGASDIKPVIQTGEL